MKNKEITKSDILTKEDVLLILSDIARDSVRDCDRIAAIEVLFKVMGW